MKKPIIVASIIASAILLLAATGPIINRLSDIPDASGLRTATNNQVPGYNVSTKKWLPITPPGASGGEANDGANLGTGYGVFWDKAGLNLRFRGLTNVDDSLALTTNGTTILFGVGASIPRLAYTNNWSGPNALTNSGNTISGNGAGLTGLNIVESSISLSDVTNLNASTTKHGLLPKLNGNAATYLDGSGNLSAPVTGGSLLTSTNTWTGPNTFTTEPINSSLTFDAVVKEMSGYVSNGLTALTVTGGSFVAADVGKTIQVWQPDRVFADAIITNGTAQLVSATAAFTAVDLGKTVEVSGAGVAGVSLLSTVSSVDSATQVTLAANASTTVSNVTARIISLPLVTTIAAIGGATTATLTAGPSVTQTNAHVVYGTDNRVAFSNDVALAQASNRRLVIGSGKAMILLRDSNPWATALSTNSLVIAGKNRGTTEIITVWNALPPFEEGLIRVNTSASFRASDITFRGYGPCSPTNSNSIINSPVTIQMVGGGATQYLELDRIDIIGMVNGVVITSGSANARFFRANNCRWIAANGPSGFFTADGGTYERKMTDVYMESTHPMTTAMNDAAYNSHVCYDHPNVAEDWTDVTTKAVSKAGGLFHLHHYGGPSDEPAFMRFTRTRHLGNGSAFFIARNGITPVEFVDPLIQCSGGITSGRDVTISGGQTRMSGQTQLLGASINTSGQHYRIFGHDYYNTNTLASFLTGAANSTIEIVGCRITGVGTQIQSPSCRITHVGTTFVGVSPVTLAGSYSSGSNSVIKFIGCTFQGTYTVACISYGTSTNIDLEVTNCRNDTSVPIVKEFPVSGNDGKAYGSGNYFSVSGSEPESAGRLGSHFASRQMLNPDTIASASAISPSFNFNAHQITGSTTINTMLVGGSVNRNRVAYEVTLIPAAGATWAIGSTGNVIALSAVARTAGQAYTFRWDSIDQKWREVGLPGGVTGSSTNAFVNTLSSITGLTGGGATNLDGIATVTVPAGVIVAVTFDTTRTYLYRLIAATVTNAPPLYVRPTDYAGGSNEKVWILWEYVFPDRTGPEKWQWFGTNDVARLYDGVGDRILIDTNGTVTATLFSGSFGVDLDDLKDGSLTGSKVGPGISAANITVGTLPDARLSSNVPLKDTPNTFTKTNTFPEVNVTNAVNALLFNGIGTGSGLVRLYDLDASANWVTTVNDTMLTNVWFRWPAYGITGWPVFLGSASTNLDLYIHPDPGTNSLAGWDNTGKTNRYYTIGSGFSLSSGVLSATGSATAAGSSGDVQFNGGATNLAADSLLNYNSTNKTLTLSNLTFNGKVTGNGSTNGQWQFLDDDGDLFTTIGAPHTIVTNGVYLLPVQPDTGLFVGTNSSATNVQMKIFPHPAANGKILYTTNTPFGGYFWADPPAAGSVPSGTVVNTGASAVNQVPRYTDTTGTNVAPSTMTVAALGGMVITNSDTTNVSLLIKGPSGGTNLIFDVGTNGVSSLAVNSAGSVLIGSGTASRPAIGFAADDDGTGTGYYHDAANSIGITINGVEKWQINSGSLSAVGASQSFDVGSGGTYNFGTNTRLGSGGNQIWVFGVDNSVPALAHIRGPNGSGANIIGAGLELTPGTSTGTGASGALIFKSGESSTTGSTLNGSVPRFYMSAKGVDLTGGTATLVFNISLASGKTCGLHVFATTRVNDGTDFQSATDDFTAAAVNKGGTVSIGSISTSLGSTIATSGTISTVWTAVANGNGIDVKCNETSTVITPTVRRVKWRVEVDTDDTASTITPQ